MQIYFILIIIILVIGFAIAIWSGRQKIRTGDEAEKLGALMEKLSSLSDQNRDLRQTIDTKLAETHRSNQEQFGQTAKIIQGISSQSAKLISDVTEKLTKLDETNKQVVGFADQLQNLQDILKNPKQRGILGEYYLETVLKNVLAPKSYEMQYKMGKDDEGRDLIVDAAVFVKDKIIPIDSKFSLENYNRILEERDPVEKEKLEKLFKQDLKNRIDETSKYIKPERGTMDFAFMFIPSEAIFYDLLINQVGAVKVNTRDLIEYAFKEKHVIIVSPTSFLAYLQTVLQGLKAMQIEDSVKDVIKRVGELNKHLASYEDYLKKLGNNISTVVNTYNQGYREYKKIDKDVVKVIGGESKVDAMQLEKPNID
jgi:DNA recombination protein RmuC